MNSNKISNRTAVVKIYLARTLSMLVVCALFASASFAQQTAADTDILNQASATYSDGTTTYTTVSNTVTVKVAKVSGLVITPDGGSNPTVVPGQSAVNYYFSVQNTGNFADQVRFLANGASVSVSANAQNVAAVIDVNGNNLIDAGDIDIYRNTADVISPSIAQNGTLKVIVSLGVRPEATPSSSVSVSLGDTTAGSPNFDNQPADSSAGEVRTVSTLSVNGLREAKGSQSSVVEADAALKLTLTAPSGPLSAATDTTPGSNINYLLEVCNTGNRAASTVTLTNAPSGSQTGVFIIAPIPVGTALASGQTFPTGTLFSTDALTVSPLQAVYTTTAPANLTTVRRVAFNAGSSLAAGGCSTAFPLAVTITTKDATLDIFEIGDVFGSNTKGQLTDQSGDTVSNKGDGNADFNEPVTGGTVSSTQGFQQVTTLTRTGASLIGPLGAPDAVGPTSNNDDYTNRSVTTGIAGLGFGSTSTAAGVVVYQNTIRNTGNAKDTFVITVPSAPAGFTVEISTDGGATYTTMTGSNSVSVSNVASKSDATIFVRVTAPAGTPVLAENGFPTTIRATSTLTPTAYNETIDRLYTGFLRMEKSFVITNGTGVGSATDAVPGAVIEYSILYRNIATTGGTGNSTLAVSNLVITENGAVAPNNWAATTTQVVGSASDTRGGTITGDAAGSTVLTDTVATLPAQQSGTFKFSRTIR